MAKNTKTISAKKRDNRINVLGVGVDSTTRTAVLTMINDQCQMSNTAKPLFIVTVNPEFVMLAQDDPEFKNILNNADLAIPDGVGLRFAQKTLNIIPGRKLVEEILKLNKYKVFFLGGQNGVVQEMAEKFGGEFDSGETDIKHPTRNTEIITKINKYKPDILLVAYGAPYQEKWLNANSHRLNARVRIGVGGAFDYLTGRSIVPPEWVSGIGLEWLWRLYHEPWRWRRQLNLIRFIFAIFKSSFQ